MNIQGWFPRRLTGLISVQSKWLSRLFSNTTIWKHHFFGTHTSLWTSSLPIHNYWKIIALTIMDLCGKVIALFLNMLYRFVIASLLRNKQLLISWLQSLSSVILEPKKIKIFTVPSLGELKMQSKIWPCMYEDVKFHLQCTYWDAGQGGLVWCL